MPGMDSPRSEAPSHPDLKVKEWESPSSKIRKTYLFSGISPEADVRCYNNTIQGMERALKERLFYIPDGNGGWTPKPSHAPGVVLDKMQRFLADMKPLSSYTHPWTREQFSDSYTGQKKERYHRATKQLNQSGLTAKDCELKFFMKFETFNLSTKPNPSPRGINPPDDKYLVEFGRYIKPVEKKIYDDVETLFGYKVIVKGLNQEERGLLIHESWTSFSDPVCVALDASKFEQSVSAECIEFEKQLYSRYYPGDKHFKWMIEKQKSFRGRARSQNGSLSFKISGVRASGMNNTALGNCVISAGFLYDIRARLKSVDKKFDFRAHVDGDDVIVVMERRHFGMFSQFSKPYYQEASFRMKFEEPVDLIEHIDFCQSRPIFDGVKYLMVRNVVASLSKDAVSKKPLDNKKIFEKWSAAVGQGGISCTGGIPIQQNFYQCLLRASNGAKPLENDPLQRSARFKTANMNRTITSVSPETRASYWLAFGIEPDAQILIEEFYDNFSICQEVDSQRYQRHVLLPWG